MSRRTARTITAVGQAFTAAMRAAQGPAEPGDVDAGPATPPARAPRLGRLLWLVVVGAGVLWLLVELIRFLTPA